MVHRATNGGETMLDRSFVDCLPNRASTNVPELLLGVDGDAVEIPGEVDDQPALTGRRPRWVVAAALDSDDQVGPFGVLDGERGILRIFDESDNGSFACSVLGPSCDRLIIIRVAGGYDVPFEGGLECFEAKGHGDWKSRKTVRCGAVSIGLGPREYGAMDARIRK